MSARKRRPSKPPASGVHRVAAPASPQREPTLAEIYPDACGTIPQLGTCANDLHVAFSYTLTALGVNLRANQGFPNAVTILSHAVTSELSALDLVISKLDDCSAERLTLEQIRERLAFVSECSGTLSKAYAASSHHTLSTARATKAAKGGAR